jgi:Xaa-Pro aminopeptidase
VLKGHIALATARFPAGVAGPHLDALARRPLWDAGLDYDHGTGHGVGSFLSVHEGPVAFSRAARVVPLREGMILSNEPGFYAAGEYGIRLENLLLVVPADLPQASRPFLAFETLTLAPFDRALIEPALLTAAERAWLDAYHARVLAEVAPQLDAATAAWLEAACAPL